MKATGIVRRIDELGRVVIPKEIRRTQRIRRGDPLEIFTTGDGEVIEGIASVDESAITGESAPVVREAGGDRSAVTGGTTVLSDWIIVKISSEPGQSFLDKMTVTASSPQPGRGGATLPTAASASRWKR